MHNRLHLNRLGTHRPRGLWWSRIEARPSIDDGSAVHNRCNGQHVSRTEGQTYRVAALVVVLHALLAAVLVGLIWWAQGRGE